MTVARPMVLEDFFEINAPVIHTPTLEEAVELCRAMNDMGLTWRTEGTYQDNNFSTYGSETCYNPAEGSYADRKWYKGCGRRIVSYSAVRHLFIKTKEEKCTQ